MIPVPALSQGALAGGAEIGCAHDQVRAVGSRGQRRDRQCGQVRVLGFACAG